MGSFRNKSLIVPFLFIALILSPPRAAAQSSNNNNSNSDGLPYSNFSPSMAIIIVVLVAALFFMGFFSIYIRHCSDPGPNNSLRSGILGGQQRRANASRGLEKLAIENFPTFTYAEVKDHMIGKGALECAVCLNEFEDDETLRLIPKCDHVFHPECIDAWLESHVTCPVCRANLTPQPGEEGAANQSTPEAADGENQENDGERASAAQRNDDEVPVQVVCENPPETQETVRPRVKRNFSFDQNQPPLAGSVRRGIGVFSFARFRSHSTGHSFVQPGENLDRFTLRLPDEKRKEIIEKASLNRTKSYLANGGSARRGYRTGAGAGEGSSRSIRSYKAIEPLDRAAQSDRWVFTRAPSFFTRALSIRSPRTPTDNGDGSSKGGKTTMRMPSFKCLEPKAADEVSLVATDSARPPV